LFVENDEKNIDVFDQNAKFLKHISINSHYFSNAKQISQNRLIIITNTRNLYLFDLENYLELITDIRLLHFAETLIELDSDCLLLGMKNGELHKLQLSTLTSTILFKTELKPLQEMIQCKGDKEQIGLVGEGGVVFGKLVKDSSEIKFT